MVNSGHADASRGVPTDPQAAKILPHFGIIACVGTTIRRDDIECRRGCGTYCPPSVHRPIARVLVKRMAQKAMCHEDFYQMLAEYIPDEAQRITFLAKMKNHTRDGFRS